MNGQQMQRLYAEAQERQAWLTRGFFASYEELVDRARRRQAASRTLAPEGPANSYVDFLECLFFYYREDVRAAERSSTGAGGVRPP